MLTNLRNTVAAGFIATLIIYVLVRLFLAATPAFAETAGPTPTAVSFLTPYADPAVGQPANPAWWALSLDLVWKLALIVGLIYLTVWLLRRFASGARGAAWRPGAVSVLDTTFLAPNRVLYLVDVGGRMLLLGATATQLSTLAEIADAEQVGQLRQRYERPAGPTFGDQVRTIADRLGARDRAEGSPDAAASSPPTFDDGGTFLRARIAELRTLSSAFQPPEKKQ